MLDSIFVLLEGGAEPSVISPSTGLANVVTLVSHVVDEIVGNDVLMTVFCGSLLVTGAMVFKKIKKSARS